MPGRRREIRIRFRVTPEELSIIQQKQAQAKVINREAFLRTSVLEGRVLVLDIPEMRQVSALLGHCSGNLNQIAKRLNTTGRYYAGELSECTQELQKIENILRNIFEELERVGK